MGYWRILIFHGILTEYRGIRATVDHVYPTEQLEFSNKAFFLDTVEPHPVDTAPLWTPHPSGHFLPGPFVFLIQSY